ncbi:MAG TPA: hypothetical protein VFV67_31915 [Actinophytocola sp.]|uniref:tetratricopeptide repeat protein n=1 Tax=Actinophytocola sp. TaxID=1872138 RepID=UPI002DB713ED|nr:hypothetical protein [Actinophytocola sp.]HEU5475274.1 hypothetical protein [Actinophytocola sp.]
MAAATGVVVLLATGYSVVRQLKDDAAYRDGHEAYQRADCVAAIDEFDSVINAYRIVTVGDTVERAERERAECKAFEVAAVWQRAGNKPRALASYVQFVHGRPAGPLTDAARARVTDLLEEPDLAEVATEPSCRVLDLLRKNAMVGPETGPGIHSACGTALTEAHDLDQALDAYAGLFADYPTHRIAAEAEGLIVRDARWCGHLAMTTIRQDPVLAARGELYPTLLANCATAPAVWAEDAENAAEEFLQKYPGHPRTGEVTVALARSMTKLALENGDKVDWQPYPDGSAGPNEAVIFAHNEGVVPYRIALSGPDGRVVTVDACATCRPLPRAEGESCGDHANLKRIVVTPGEYDVVLAHGVPRYAITRWILRPGRSYFFCLTPFR